MFMQAHNHIEKANLDSDSTDAGRAIRVVIAYNNITSGQRVVRQMTHLAQGMEEPIKFEMLLWSFALLSDRNGRDAAAHDAVNADILIFATSSANPLPPVVGRWAETAISRMAGTAGSVVALFGTEENLDATGSSRLAEIRGAAERAGLGFFAPEPREELDEAIASTHRRAEMVTPVLGENVLHHHPVAAPGSKHMAATNTFLEAGVDPAKRGAEPDGFSAVMARRQATVPPRARILYVDDDMALRRLGELVLTRAGYEVDTAKDGAEAWAALNEVSYNLIITDHDMPRLTGLELMARARQAGMSLPIVMTSGSLSPEDDLPGAKSDFATFLAKPFSSDTLVEVVEKSLRAANQGRKCSDARISALARLALSAQPYLHGGINE